MTKLSTKQEAFCIEIAKGENQTQAAINAGYSPKTAKEMAYENLTKPHIADRIKALSQREKTRRIISIDERQELLSNIAEEREGDMNARLKAIDILNKMDGLYIQKHEVKVTKSLADVLKEVDDGTIT